MPRPVKGRTAKTYKRDVESLTRLRMALKLDSKLPKPQVEKVTKEIDILVNSLVELIQLQEV